MPAFAAQKFIDGHTRLTALDIPQRLIDAADGVIQNWAVAPVRRVVHGLPQIFNRICGAANQKWFEVEIDSVDNQVSALRKCRAAVTVQAVLIGSDLDDN